MNRENSRRQARRDEAQRRTQQALAETIVALARAERYSYDLRDHDLIACYKASIQRLTEKLADW